LRQVKSDGTLVAILERYVQLPKELTNLK